MQRRRLFVAEIVTDPIESAKAIGLRYVSDQMPGIRRVRSGESFRYQGPNGAVVRDEDQRRIKSLVIPPAWTDVWICRLARGHIQVTGHDVRGRKQYRYHPRWREVRDEAKYNRMIEFGRTLPRIRARIRKDMSLPGLSKDKVLATVVRLLEVSLIRVGNDEYARDNKSFGLTTMRDQHVQVAGSMVRFRFRGKSGKQHSVEVDDARLARIVKRCQELPGQELFQYLDESGSQQDVGSADVNAYLREITGQDFTAKDFRTWAGTVLAARALQELEQVDSQAKAKKNIVRAVEAVAQMLGNTPTICRKCYVHPAVLQAYLDGALLSTLGSLAEDEIASSLPRLRPEEAAVLAFLELRLVTEGRDENRVRPWSHTRPITLRRTSRRTGRPKQRGALPSSWRS